MVNSCCQICLIFIIMLECGRQFWDTNLYFLVTLMHQKHIVSWLFRLIYNCLFNILPMLSTFCHLLPQQMVVFDSTSCTKCYEILCVKEIYKHDVRKNLVKLHSLYSCSCLILQCLQVLPNCNNSVAFMIIYGIYTIPWRNYSLK